MMTTRVAQLNATHSALGRDMPINAVTAMPKPHLRSNRPPYRFKSNQASSDSNAAAIRTPYHGLRFTLPRMRGSAAMIVNSAEQRSMITIGFIKCLRFQGWLSIGTAISLKSKGTLTSDFSVPNRATKRTSPVRCGTSNTKI